MPFFSPWVLLPPRSSNAYRKSPPPSPRLKTNLILYSDPGDYPARTRRVFPPFFSASQTPELYFFFHYCAASEKLTVHLLLDGAREPFGRPPAARSTYAASFDGRDLFSLYDFHDGRTPEKTILSFRSPLQEFPTRGKLLKSGVRRRPYGDGWSLSFPAAA